MFPTLRVFRRWLSLAGLLCALGWCGCQNLDAPWTTSEGLPPQWEPKMKNVEADE